ncbi:MAG TPA: hypothetical protein VEA40_11585 [Ramlibacter sp.]|nr:hypothetical protein [Ramlibacter sp.]
MSRPLLLAALLLACGGAQAQSACSSDGRFQPPALHERFINADCPSCWTEAPAAVGGAALVLDWIVPGRRGEDAPLAGAATRDALRRLQALKRDRPDRTDEVRHERTGAAGTLRVAQGPAVGGYVGTSIELRNPRPGGWAAWLALVEVLPAGTEGSPVERRLVRNVLQVDWPPGAPRFSDSRPMRIPEGAKAERLQVVGWVEDSAGQVRGIAQAVC